MSQPHRAPRLNHGWYPTPFSQVPHRVAGAGPVLDAHPLHALLPCKEAWWIYEGENKNRPEVGIIEETIKAAVRGLIWMGKVSRLTVKSDCPRHCRCLID